MKVEFKTEIELNTNFYNNSEGIINLLDEMLVARDELFEKKLINGLMSSKNAIKLPRQE